MIDSFFSILQSHFNKRQSQNGLKIFCFLTYFHDKLTSNGSNYDYSKVQGWTKPSTIKRKSSNQNMTSIFDFDLLLFPINAGGHWILAVINVKDKKLQYYNSMQLSALKKNQPQECFGVNFISFFFSFFFFLISHTIFSTVSM